MVMGITGIQMGAGMGMVMNEREWEEMGMRNEFPLISTTVHAVIKMMHQNKIKSTYASVSATTMANSEELRVMFIIQ
jgi:hypothetical protein